VVVSGIAVTRLGRATAPYRFLPLGLLLSMFSDFNHALVVAVHTIDPLAGLGKNEFVYAVLADLTIEAVCMV